MKRSNIQLIEKFIRENQQAMYRFAYSYVKNKSDALDVVQDSICKAITNEEKLKKPSKVKSWIFTIIRNTSLNLIAKGNKEELSGEVTNKKVINIKTSAEKLDLENALQELTPKEYEMIVMRFFEGFQLNEMAELMDLNINTLKSRYYKVLDKLRVVYDKKEAYNG